MTQFFLKFSAHHGNDPPDLNRLETSLRLALDRTGILHQFSRVGDEFHAQFCSGWSKEQLEELFTPEMMGAETSVREINRTCHDCHPNNPLVAQAAE